MKLVNISEWYGNCDGSFLYINPETISRIDTGVDDDGTEHVWVSFVDDVCLVLDCGFEEFCARIGANYEIR